MKGLRTHYIQRYHSVRSCQENESINNSIACQISTDREVRSYFRSIIHPSLHLFIHTWFHSDHKFFSSINPLRSHMFLPLRTDCMSNICSIHFLLPSPPLPLSTLLPLTLPLHLFTSPYLNSVCVKTSNTLKEQQLQQTNARQCNEDIESQEHGMFLSTCDPSNADSGKGPM